MLTVVNVERGPWRGCGLPVPSGRIVTTAPAGDGLDWKVMQVITLFHYSTNLFRDVE